MTQTHTEFGTDTCTPVFMALFTTVKRWKQLKGPSADRRINTTWSLCTMEYHSASEGKGIPAPAPTWMSLEDVMLSLKPDTKGRTLCDPTSRRSLDSSNSQTQRVDGGARGWGRGGGYGFMETESQFGKMKKFWSRMVVMSTQQCECS